MTVASADGQSSFAALSEGFGDGVRQFRQSLRNTPAAARRLRQAPRSVVGGASLAPLLVLYGHTLVDAVDRTGFNTILPDIRDTFGLSTDDITAVAAIALFVSLLLGVPVAHLSDRGTRRTWWLASGALLAGVFSIFTGLAGGATLFIAARAGFGLGIRLNDPVQASLLSDYYAVETRPFTFAGRQGMDNAGQLLGPLFFGGAAALFGWRTAVVAISVPSLILFVASLRLREPRRGAPEREAMGVEADAEVIDEEPARFFEAMRILHRVVSIRRIYFAVPFLVGGVLGLGVLLPLFLEEVFGLGAGGRGVVLSIGNVAGIAGLFFGVPIAKRYLVSGKPEGMLDLLGLSGVIASVALVGVAMSPNLVIMTLCGLGFWFWVSLFVPGFATVLAMIVPARVRGMGFALLGLWALPGLIMLPIAGSIGDEYGLRWGMVVGLPLLAAGAVIVSRGKLHLRRDIEAAFQAAMAALQSEPDATPDLTSDGAETPGEKRQRRQLSADRNG